MSMMKEWERERARERREAEESPSDPTARGRTLLEQVAIDNKICYINFHPSINADGTIAEISFEVGSERRHILAQFPAISMSVGGLARALRDMADQLEREVLRP